MSLLNNKIAVVTAASSGTGLATAKGFAEEGAHVFIAGRRQAELDKAVLEIGATKGDHSEAGHAGTSWLTFGDTLKRRRSLAATHNQFVSAAAIAYIAGGIEHGL